MAMKGDSRKENRGNGFPRNILLSMSINQTDIIDIIGTTPEGRITLTISNHLSWDESGHLQLLHDKINGYIHFIESGQIFKEYPNAAGKELIIETAMKFEPDPEAVSFLQKVKEIARHAGICFQWRVLTFHE